MVRNVIVKGSVSNLTWIRFPTELSTRLPRAKLVKTISMNTDDRWDGSRARVATRAAGSTTL